ncbi:MAG: ATP-binding cassette domain-containing protein, partial [Lachnospiraceae bacterium]|nr:ATP-binding cassette domain-containing protein [Lachnospiraceae bacterium]
MAQILVSDLTFCYDGSFGNIFEHASFSIDTDWKLGFLGRNGKGKSTFLALLQGKYEYQGVISASTSFDYFPYKIPDFRMGECASAFLDELKSGCEEWRVLREMDALAAEAELLYRPFQSLSFGERTKVLLAILFSGENDFPLIDEPTNHLDMETRETVKRYLRGKKGFILVSHDRDLLDACVDHVLVLNRKTIEVQSGNFSTWWENKKRKDSFAQAENEKHLREIDSLKKAADRTRRWADLNENTKIGFDPVKEPDRCKDTRAFIGAKTKKAQARVLAYEKRIGREIEEKEGLLQDIENPAALKLYPLTYHKERLLYAKNLELSYEGRGEPVLSGLSFEMGRGERVLLQGINGSGKSTLIHAILSEIMKKSGEQGTRAGKATPRG